MAGLRACEQAGARRPKPRERQCTSRDLHAIPSPVRCTEETPGARQIGCDDYEHARPRLRTPVTPCSAGAEGRRGRSGPDVRVRNEAHTQAHPSNQDPAKAPPRRHTEDVPPCNKREERRTRHLEGRHAFSTPTRTMGRKCEPLLVSALPSSRRTRAFRLVRLPGERTRAYRGENKIFRVPRESHTRKTEGEPCVHLPRRFQHDHE